MIKTLTLSIAGVIKIDHSRHDKEFTKVKMSMLNEMRVMKDYRESGNLKKWKFSLGVEKMSRIRLFFFLYSLN